MAIPANLKQQIESRLKERIQLVRPISGGDIATALVIQTHNNRHYFLKAGEIMPPDMFPSEADGLAAIAQTQTIRTPAVIFVADTYLLLEFIKDVTPTSNYWANFGRQLAELHTQPAEGFGFDRNNYCGATPQPNPWYDNGYHFFASQRLNYQAVLAFDKGLLSIEEVRLIEKLGNRLPELVPPQPPSLLHGDLWSGNQLCDEQQQPVLFDPACYYGWAEADIAMTRLFGGFDERFYQTYLEVNPLEQGWQQRCAIYNLYHLLNHLNLFGHGYYAQVRTTINSYC